MKLIRRSSIRSIEDTIFLLKWKLDCYRLNRITFFYLNEVLLRFWDLGICGPLVRMECWPTESSLNCMTTQASL